MVHDGENHRLTCTLLILKRQVLIVLCGSQEISDHDPIYKHPLLNF